MAAAGERALADVQAEREDVAPGDVQRAVHLVIGHYERMFAPLLGGLGGADRERRLATLIAICDVSTWKLLRRDRGLSRAQTELALRKLLGSMNGGSR